MALPLDGLRVVSLCVGAVMPELTKILGEFGADVIKVESRVFPDLMRRAGGADLDAGPGFNEANRNKRSFAVNLQTVEGQHLVQALVATADIFGENYRGDVVQKWGLDYDTVSLTNPEIIYVSSQGFGRGGPSERFPTMGPNLAPSFGLTYLWAHPDDPFPIGATLNHPDHIAGKQGLVAVLAALDYRRRTGQGQQIDLSQAEAGVAMLGERFLEYTMNQVEPSALGNASLTAAPHGVYPCAGEDRWCAVSVQSDDEWERLVDLMERPPWAADVRLTTTVGRIAARAEIDEHLGQWTRTYGAAELMQVLQQEGIAAGYIQTATDHLSDPHLKAREAFIELDHPVVGRRMYPNANQLRLAGTPTRSVRAPLLGEHTDEICRSILGLNDAEITRLRSDLVIGY